jgi:hypothetical protein
MLIPFGTIAFMTPIDVDKLEVVFVLRTFNH